MCCISDVCLPFRKRACEMEFDLNEYASRYTGHTLLLRLQFIIQQQQQQQKQEQPYSPELIEQAYRLLHDVLKNGNHNTGMYIQTFAGKKPFEEFQYDHSWVDETDRKANMKLEALESELQSAKSSMIKESIRVALNDLGDYYLQRGNLVEAIKSYARTRDFSSMPKHTDEYSLNLIITSIGMDKIMNIANYIGKIDDPDTSLAVKDKLRIVKALLFLSQSNYEQCAKTFLSITSCENILYQFPQVISTHDIAIYTTLCSLATLNRNQIRKLLLENREFKSILDCVPLTRILLNEFLEGKYSSVIEKLNHFQNILLLDLYFHKHIEKILQLIRNHLVITYLTPFSSVHLQDMCQVFNLTQDEIEDILCLLISSSQLQGKIDILTNTFQRMKPLPRDQILESVCQLSGKEFPLVVERSLFRLQLMKSNIVVVSNKESSSFHAMGIVDERNDLMELSSL
jgi:COP9 signalosome complex subunit 1